MNNSGTIFDIRDYGAVAGGKVLCTEAIERAIQACSAAGGGIVLVAGGTYLTATVQLRSNITLHIASGAKLLGSADIRDYEAKRPYDRNDIYCTPVLGGYPVWALIFADGAENIAVEGHGTIDNQGGMGGAFPDASVTQEGSHLRPFGIWMIDCKNIRLTDFTFENPAIWTTRLEHCRQIQISNVTIHSLKTPNGDGLDFVGSSDVMISNCMIEAGDDGISLKALEPEDICENYVISNCIISSWWAGIRIGGETNAPMRNINVSNCTFDGCGDAIKIHSCGGSVVENMIFADLTMKDVERPFFIAADSYTFSKRPPVRPVPSIIRDMVFHDIMACTRHDKRYDIIYDKIPGSVISGSGENVVERLYFRNISLCAEGGESDPKNADIVVREFLDYMDKYAEARNFGRPCVPASGFFLRRIRNCRFENICLRINKPDVRAAIACDLVTDTVFENVQIQPSAIAAEEIKTANCQDIKFANTECRVREIDGEERMRYDREKEKAEKMLRICQTECFEIDRARAAEQIAFIPKNVWTVEKLKGGLRACVRFSLKIKPKHRTYIYFQWLRGDSVLFLNGKKVGERVLPEGYGEAFYWAVAAENWQEENELIIELKDREQAAFLDGYTSIREEER